MIGIDKKYSVFRRVLSPVTVYGISRDFNINNMTGAASGTVPVYPSEVHDMSLLRILVGFVLLNI